MRVAIINPANGKITGVGECDGKRYDDMYLKVYRDGVEDKSSAMALVFAASVFPEELAEEISMELVALHELRVHADNNFTKYLYEAANKFKAFTGTEIQK